MIYTMLQSMCIQILIWLNGPLRLKLPPTWCFPVQVNNIKNSKLFVTGPCWGDHRWPVGFHHKGTVTEKISPYIIWRYDNIEYSKPSKSAKKNNPKNGNISNIFIPYTKNHEYRNVVMMQIVQNVPTVIYTYSNISKYIVYINVYISPNATDNRIMIVQNNPLVLRWVDTLHVPLIDLTRSVHE